MRLKRRTTPAASRAWRASFHCADRPAMVSKASTAGASTRYPAAVSASVTPKSSSYSPTSLSVPPMPCISTRGYRVKAASHPASQATARV